MSKYFIGLDLGQSADSTAIAVSERIAPPATTLPPSYLCGHLERLPLGTHYPAIVEFVGKLMQTPELKGQSTLVIDATGVGRPVCDMFTQAGLEHVAVTITGGDRVNFEGGAARVPKRILVSTLQVLLQSKRLDVAPHMLREILIQELLAFQVTISEAANDCYEGRKGAHDDMVLAIALSTWRGEWPVAPTLPPAPTSATRRY